jgi:anaerobic selenocysteine-containing dehydrogenase
VIDTVLPNKKWRLYTPILAAELQRVLANASTSAPALYLVSIREDNHLNTQFTQKHEVVELPQARIHEKVARDHDLANGSVVKLHSAHGVMLVRIKISDEARVNTVCVPHGYKGLGNVSGLTSETQNINPISGMVTQTAIPIHIEKTVLS